MQRITISWTVLFCCITLILSGCSSTLPFSQTSSSAYYNKEMHLESDMLLAESTHWNPSGQGRNWVFSFAHQRYRNNYIDLTIPTRQEYEQNRAQWQEWHGGVLDGWSRLVGVLPKGTAFRIVDIAPRNERSGYWVSVRFENGPYKDRTAIYVNARSLIPDMYK